VIEVKATEDPFPSNKPMDFRTVMPVKGLGRISMILWGVYWTYLQKDNLDEDARQDFARRGAYLQFGNISNHKGWKIANWYFGSSWGIQIPRISNVMVSAKPSSQLSAPMYPRIAIMCYNDMLGHHVIKVLHPKHRIISLWVWNWCIIGIMGSSIGPSWRDGLDGNVVLEKSCFPLFWGDAFYHSGVLGPWTTGVWVSTTIPGQVARHREGPEGQVHRGESDRLHLEAATSPRAAERETEKERAPESSYVRCPC